MPTLQLPILACLAAIAVTLSACGGGGDFSGDPSVPDGYKTYEGAGVSFVYPGDWQVDERTSSDGGPFVEVSAADTSQTPYSLIQLSVTPDAADRFESLSDQRRLVLRDVNDAEIDSDESVDVPGADSALRATFTVPPGQGSDPVEVQTDSLDVLRSNGDVIVLTAASVQREGQSFDPAAVISSFRLED